MQQVVNCMYVSNGKMLLLYKQPRNWWVAPGGKVETGESLSEACLREYKEETGLTPLALRLSSIFTVNVREQEQISSSWMFYNFVTNNVEGQLLTESTEGILSWHNLNNLNSLQMAEGDRVILAKAVELGTVIVGTVNYTPSYKLIDLNYVTC